MIDHLQFGWSNSQTSTSSLSFWSMSIDPFFHHFPKHVRAMLTANLRYPAKKTAGWITSYIPIGEKMMICSSKNGTPLKNKDFLHLLFFLYMAKTSSFNNLKEWLIMGWFHLSNAVAAWLPPCYTMEFCIPPKTTIVVAKNPHVGC